MTYKFYFRSLNEIPNVKFTDLIKEPTELIGGFEGTLRPLSPVEKIKEIVRKQEVAINLLDSPLGTDDNDDQHRITLFEKRKGNVSEVR